MQYENFVAVLANWAAILTAGLASYAYGKYRIERWIRRRALEQHLRTQKLMGVDEGMRTILHLIANLSMTEAEILSAAFDSKKVRSAVSVDDRGRATALLFEYDSEEVEPRKPF